jgi:hypothetical protein
MEPGHLPAPSPPVGIEEDSELAPSRYTAQSSAEGERLAPLLGTKKKRRVPWTKFQSRYGWRLIVWYGFVSGALVFCVNILLLGLGTRHGGYKGGIGTLAQGTATRISTISTAYHVLINIMSTSLLASSNYCMQVLSSPTRQAIDDAHEKGWYLDVGVWSSRNLRYLSRRKRVLWSLLAVSSLPLHLLYAVQPCLSQLPEAC